MLIYLGAPYSHTDKSVVKERMRRFYKTAARLFGSGAFVVSPLLNDPLLEFDTLPSDWAFWQAFSETLLSRCDKLVVLRLEGWENSSGVTGEIKFCKANNIPVEYIDYVE